MAVQPGGGRGVEGGNSILSLSGTCLPLRSTFSAKIPEQGVNVR